MKIRKSNKKAQTGHAITWIHKFFILVLVVGGVIAVVTSHYGKQYDVREPEAQILAKNLMECIAPKGILNNPEIKQEIISSCIVLDEKEHYLNLTENNQTLSFGDPFLLTLCQVDEKSTVKKYPSCLGEEYVLLGKENKEHTIYLFLAIKKIEKNL